MDLKTESERGLIQSERKIHSETVKNAASSLIAVLSELDSSCCSFEQREREPEEQTEVLEERLTQVKVRETEIEEIRLGEVSVNERLSEVEKKEMEVEELIRDTIEREKRVEETLGKVKLREDVCESKFQKLQEMIKEVELREEETRSYRESADLRSKELRAKRFSLDESAKQLKDREKELEERIRLVEMREMKAESKENLLRTWEGDRVRKSEMWTAEVESKGNELRRREESIERSMTELDAARKLFDESAGKLKDREEGLDKRIRDVKVRDIKVGLKENDLRIREESAKKSMKELDESAKKLKDREEDLNELIREVKARETSVELKENDLRRREESIEKSRKELDVARKWHDKCVQELKDREECQAENENKLKDREEEFGERIREVEMRETKVRLRENELQKWEGSIETSWKELYAERKQQDEITKKLTDREEELEVRIRVLEMRENVVEERLKEVEFKEKEFRSREEDVDSGRKEPFALSASYLKDGMRGYDISSIVGRAHESLIEVDELKWEVESECQQFEERIRMLVEKESTIEELSDQVFMKEKVFELRVRDFELKENDFYKELELKRNQYEQLFGELELIRKQIEKEGKEVQLRKEEIDRKERQIEERGKDLRLIETLGMVDKDVKGHVTSPCICVSLVMDGKALQILLNERFNEHDKLKSEIGVVLRQSADPAALVLDAVEGFYPPRLKNGDVEFQEDVVRQSCVMLLEQLMNMSPVIKPHVREAAKKLTFDWVTKMRADAEHSVEVLGFLLLIACYGLASTFDEAELLSYFKITAKHSQAHDLSRVLGFADKTSDFLFENNGSSSLDLQPQQKNSTGEADIRSMRLLLSGDENHDSLPSEVIWAFRLARDPARLVLDVISDPLPSKEVTTRFELCVSRKSCVLLLEQLRRLSPQIKPELKEEALKFALSWNEKYPVHRKNFEMHRVFLELVAAYGLASYFNKDLLSFLINNTNYDTEVPGFARLLGSLDLVQYFVNGLVKQDKRLEAIRYICDAGMVGKFPVHQYLTDHLNYCKKLCKDHLQSLEGKGDNTSGQTEVMEKDIALVREVIGFVRQHNLELFCPISPLEERIVGLQQKIGKNRCIPESKLKPSLKHEASRREHVEKKRDASRRVHFAKYLEAPASKPKPSPEHVEKRSEPSVPKGTNFTSVIPISTAITSASSATTQLPTSSAVMGTTITPSSFGAAPTSIAAQQGLLSDQRTSLQELNDKKRRRVVASSGESNVFELKKNPPVASIPPFHPWRYQR